MATVYPFCNATGCGICSGDQYVLMSSGNTFSEEQISGMLKLHSAGAKPSELCRQHGISEATV